MAKVITTPAPAHGPTNTDARALASAVFATLKILQKRPLQQASKLASNSLKRRTGRMNTQGNLAIAHEASTVAEPLDMIKHVSFELGEEIYAINAARVNEVLRYTEITPVPGSAYFILGIINLRGNVVTVIDARTVFGLPPLDHTQNSRIIVVEIEDFVLGILVDRVAEVIDLNKHAIEIAPATSQDESSRFIQGVYNQDDHLMILVDFSRVVELLPH